MVALGEGSTSDSPRFRFRIFALEFCMTDFAGSFDPKKFQKKSLIIIIIFFQNLFLGIQFFL